MEATQAVPSQQKFTHFGRGGELFAITLVNLLLKLVTVGIYHFWGKTKVRRYVWSHTHFTGEPFEYTGRGLELFIGYLVAMLLVAPIIAAFQFLPLYLQEYPILAGVTMFALYILFVFLAGFAAFSSRRYMLSRTRWRGIRFGMIGSAVRHGFLTLGYGFLAVITLSLYMPFLRNHLTGHLLNNTWFGDRRFVYEGKGKDLFLRYIALWFMMLGIMIVFVLILVGVFFLAGYAGRELNPGTTSLFVIPVIILMYLGFGIAWIWYSAGEMRYFAEKTRLGDTRLKLAVSTPKLIWLVASNLLLLIFSLGLAYALVVVRTARFFCENIQLQGELDLDAIAQHPEGVPGMGEGLAEAFDMGSI